MMMDCAVSLLAATCACLVMTNHVMGQPANYTETYLPLNTTTEPLEQLPPVIYSQTLGPIYIKMPTKYHNIWCNTTEGATITWVYNDYNISDEDIRQTIASTLRIHFIISHDGSLLEVYDEQSQDGVHGYVQCFVANWRGATFGERVYVTRAVLELSEHGEPFTEIVAHMGDPVTLSCDSHMTHLPHAEVTWYFNNERIPTTNRPDFFCNQGETICVISKAKMSDNGWYKCTFHINGHPKGSSKIFEVTIEDRGFNPYAVHPLNLIDHVSSPSIVESLPGSDISLRCAFRGDLTAHIQWIFAQTDPVSCQQKDIYSINISSHQMNQSKFNLQANNTILTISDLQMHDEGNYFCIADNGYDRYTHRIYVRLVSPPVLQHRVYGKETYLGGTVHLNCSVLLAIPEATTAWWVNQVLVTGPRLGHYQLEDGGQQLVLYNASLEDIGSITCNVSNRVGSTLGHRYITVRNFTEYITAPGITTADTTSTATNSTTSDIYATLELTTLADPATSNMKMPTEDFLTTLSATGMNQPEPTTKEKQINFLKSTGYREATSITRSPQSSSSQYDMTESSPSTVKDEVISSDHSYRLDVKGEAGEASRIEGGYGSEGWKLRVWPWVVIAVAVFMVGMVFGGLTTRWYLTRKQTETRDCTESIIENSSAFSSSPKHKRRHDVCSNLYEHETQSMIHGDIMETVT